MVIFRRKFDAQSYIYLLQWLLIAVMAGIAGSLTVNAFYFLYLRITGLILSVEGVPLFLWPVAGASAAGMIIYRLEPRARGEGIPSYLRSLRNNGSGRLSFSETFFKFCAALLTLSTFGNGGFLGPVGRITAGLMSSIQRLIPRRFMPYEHLPLFPICGLAAALGALVHSPIGAGIFAVEIIQKANMRYRQLFPAILASTASVYFSKFLGFEPVLSFETVHEVVDYRIAGVLIILTLTAGFTGKGFISLYFRVSRLFHREASHSPLGMTIRAVTGMLLAFWVVYLVNPNLIGTSDKVFTALFSGERGIFYGNISSGVPAALVFVILIVLKALANTLTVGSGMSAGFAGPAMLMGLLLGAAFAEIFGILPGTPEYYALMAAGFAGVFSSTMNTPIATGVLTIELFGLFYSLPAGLAAVVGFQINRHNTLYDTVLEEEEEDA